MAGSKIIRGLEKSAFRDPEEPKTRIVYSVEGHEKTRKTAFGLWGADPIVLFDTDHRAAKPIDDFRKGRIGGRERTIQHYKLELPDIESMSKKRDDTAQAAAAKTWDAFKQQFDLAYASAEMTGGVRTIIHDDVTELYELRLIAEFGRTQGIQQRDRGGANLDIWKLIDRSKESSASTIWVSKDKEEWGRTKKRNARGEIEEVNEPTGRYIPDGFKKLRYAVEVAIRTTLDDKFKFGIEVIVSGLNGETNGKKYSEADWEGIGPFGWVSYEQLPESDLSHWTGE